MGDAPEINLGPRSSPAAVLGAAAAAAPAAPLGVALSRVWLVNAAASREAPAMGWGGDIQATVPRLRAAGYATVNAQLGRLRLMPGLRVGLDSIGPVPTLEPRLSGRVTITDNTELRFATGRYQQRPETLRGPR